MSNNQLKDIIRDEESSEPITDKSHPSSNDSIEKFDNKKEFLVSIENCEEAEDLTEKICDNTTSEANNIGTEPIIAGLVFEGLPFGGDTIQFHHVIETDDDANIGNVKFVVGALPFKEDFEYRNIGDDVVIKGFPEGERLPINYWALNKADETAIQEKDIWYAFVLFLTGIVFIVSLLWIIPSVFEKIMNL